MASSRMVVDGVGMISGSLLFDSDVMISNQRSCIVLSETPTLNKVSRLNPDLIKGTLE